MLVILDARVQVEGLARFLGGGVCCCFALPMLTQFLAAFLRHPKRCTGAQLWSRGAESSPLRVL